MRGVLLVRLDHRVLVCLVPFNLRNQLLGDRLLNLVPARPIDVAEQVVELLQNIGQPVHLRFRLVSAAVGGYRIDFSVLVRQLDVAHRLLLHTVAVHVDRRQKSPLKGRPRPERAAWEREN